MRQQEKRLHDQELHIQQLEQQCEEQSQVLREHEQQMEVQEQLIDQQKALVNELITTSSASRPVGSRMEEQVTRPAAALLAKPVEGLSRPAIEAWANSASSSASQPAVAVPALPLTANMEAASFADLRASGEQRPMTAASLRESLMQAPLDSGANLLAGSDGQAVAKNHQGRKGGGALWEKALELCEEQRYLEAYKQVIAEPEETCLLRLMQHTGPIVEQLDAESNSRLIRRLIHILSSPKEPASSCIEQVFAWLWQALDVGIHFTSSQVEDLAVALQKASAPHSFKDRAEAARLLSRVSALRRS